MGHVLWPGQHNFYSFALLPLPSSSSFSTVLFLSMAQPLLQGPSEQKARVIMQNHLCNTPLAHVWTKLKSLLQVQCIAVLLTQASGRSIVPTSLL